VSETDKKNILPEEKSREYRIGRERFEKKTISWSDVRDAFVQRTLLTYLRRWVDGIGHYADFVVRKLQLNGIYCEYTFNNTPSPDGFNIYISIRVKELDAERVANRFTAIRRVIEKAREFREIKVPTENNVSEEDIEVEIVERGAENNYPENTETQAREEG